MDRHDDHFQFNSFGIAILAAIIEAAPKTKPYLSAPFSHFKPFRTVRNGK
jgi:hypothetical protein